MRHRLIQLLPVLENSTLRLLQRDSGPACVGQIVLNATGRRGFADDADLKKTPLHAFHVEHGGAQMSLTWISPGR